MDEAKDVMLPYGSRGAELTRLFEEPYSPAGVAALLSSLVVLSKELTRKWADGRVSSFFPGDSEGLLSSPPWYAFTAISAFSKARLMSFTLTDRLVEEDPALPPADFRASPSLFLLSAQVRSVGSIASIFVGFKVEEVRGGVIGSSGTLLESNKLA